jgi:hypothetical protein
MFAFFFLFGGGGKDGGSAGPLVYTFFLVDLIAKSHATRTIMRVGLSFEMAEIGKSMMKARLVWGDAGCSANLLA